MNRRQSLVLPLALLAPLQAGAQATEPAVVDETWNDRARARAVPVRIRWPAAALTVPAGGHPVVLFSHGLGGTRDAGAVWGEAWAAAGCGVVHLQHPGSDLEAVRRVAGSFADRQSLRSLSTAQQLVARLLDVRFVLDEIVRRHRGGVDQADARWATLRPTAMGLSGHSFGAHTTLGMAGQAYPGMAPLAETRLRAFMAFSPTLPMWGDARQALSGILRPVLCVTGTRDDDVLGTGASPERRMAVFAALPEGHKAQLVLNDADHMSFAGQTGRAADILPRAPVSRRLQAAHHALVARVTTDWWRAQLLDDAQARARLASPSGLAAGDSWASG